MAAPERNYLRIPRDATFPTLPLPREFGEYSHAYYIGAVELWKATGEGRERGVIGKAGRAFRIGKTGRGECCPNGPHADHGCRSGNQAESHPGTCPG